VTALALPLIAAVTLGATPFQVGLLAAVQTVPLLVLGLLAGVWVDRRRRRPLMVAADLGRFALLMLIPLGAWRGWLTFPLLLGVMAGVGTLSVVFDIASQSYVATLLPKSALVKANSQLQASYAVGEIAGPGLAGVLVSALSAPVAMLVDAASFLVSALLLGSIRQPEPAPAAPRDGRGSVRAELAEGLRAAWHTPVLRTLGIATGVWNLFENARNAMLVLFLTRTLGLSETMTGILLSLSAVGWLLGTLLPGRVAARIGLDRAILLGAAALVPAEILVASAAGPPAVAATMVGVGFLVYGVCSPIYDVNQFSLRQAIVPAHLQGRIAAVLRVLIRGTVPLGALLGGAAAEAIGLRGVAWLAVLGPPLAFAIVWFSPVRGIRDMPDAGDGGMG